MASRTPVLSLFQRQSSACCATVAWHRRSLDFGIRGLRNVRCQMGSVHKKTYFHTMFEAIKQDRISRGPIPAVLLGDFNLEITDSYPIRSALQARFWCDTRDKSSADMQLKTTCHKGKLVQKQIIFLSQLA